MLSSRRSERSCSICSRRMRLGQAFSWALLLLAMAKRSSRKTMVETARKLSAKNTTLVSDRNQCIAVKCFGVGEVEIEEPPT
jgi:mannose/cellobiose epimerase-like protein (N-acyl-D-glucosamine 2-epimerase family)